VELQGGKPGLPENQTALAAGLSQSKALTGHDRANPCSPHRVTAQCIRNINNGQLSIEEFPPSFCGTLDQITAGWFLLVDTVESLESSSTTCSAQDRSSANQVRLAFGALYIKQGLV